MRRRWVAVTVTLVAVLFFAAGYALRGGGDKAAATVDGVQCQAAINYYHDRSDFLAKNGGLMVPESATTLANEVSRAETQMGQLCTTWGGGPVTQ